MDDFPGTKYPKIKTNAFEKKTCGPAADQRPEGNEMCGTSPTPPYLNGFSADEILVRRAIIRSSILHFLPSLYLQAQGQTASASMAWDSAKGNDVPAQ